MRCAYFVKHGEKTGKEKKKKRRKYNVFLIFKQVRVPLSPPNKETRIYACLFAYVITLKKGLERLGTKTHKYLKIRANANIPAMHRYANQIPLYNFEFLDFE